MRLICCNETCDLVCNEHESRGPHAAPVCPECLSPMRWFDEPVVEFYSTDPGRDFMAALPDTTPAEQYAIPAGALLRRQA